MRFSEFSTYLQKLEKTASRLEITKILAELLSRLAPEEIEAGVYLCLGDLGPKYDQPDTGISDKMMIRILARVGELEAKEVLKAFKSKGDLGQVAQELSEKLKVKSEKLSVKEVFEKLLEVAKEAGEGSQARKVSELSQLIRKLDPLSRRYLVRIPIGTMRLGFSEKTVLEALTIVESGAKEASFAKDGASRVIKEKLEEKYRAYPNIGEIVRVVRQKGLKGLREIHLKVFTPIEPQLCQRLDTVVAMIAKMGTVAAEYKYDGTRLQIHLQRDGQIRNSKFEIRNKMFEGFEETRRGVKMFTRNLEQVQAMFPDLVEAVWRQVGAKEAILDGEAVGYDPRTGQFLPFQETLQRKRKYDIAAVSQEIPLKYFVFDILYKDGQDLTSLPLSKRHQILLETIHGSARLRESHPSTPGVWEVNSQSRTESPKVLVSKQKVTADAGELQDYFLEAKKKGFEGLVVKKIDGAYEAGNRGFNWVKFKREETGSLDDTIDCIVLGYYKGAGKRMDFGIGAFLVGVYDEVNDQILTIAKIGTGLKDVEWRELKVKSEKLKVKIVPKGIEIRKELMPDVICRPEIVVAIRADEITISPMHSSGYALRFPRMMAYRADKGPQQATTLKEIKELYKKQRRK